MTSAYSWALPLINHALCSFRNFRTVHVHPADTSAEPKRWWSDTTLSGPFQMMAGESRMIFGGILPVCVVIRVGVAHVMVVFGLVCAVQLVGLVWYPRC